MSTYDFSTLYTTLSHNLIKEKLTELIEGSLSLDCNEKRAFFISEQPKTFILRSCQKVCDVLHYHFVMGQALSPIYLHKVDFA